jgi:uncharacterized repeat protein (TIGR01451 family)
MKTKFALKTLIFVVAIALTATTVLAADSPYLTPSFWMADPLNPGHPAPPEGTDPSSAVEGYWWRDTTDQNALAQHTEDEFTGQVVNVWQDGDNLVAVYSNPNGTNVTAIVSGGDYMVVGCSGSQANAQTAKSRFNAAFPGFNRKILQGVVVPSALMEDYEWCSYWTRYQESIPAYVSDSFESAKEVRPRFTTEINRREDWIYGSLLDWGADGSLGAGSLKGYLPGSLSSPIPLTSISAETSLTLGSLQVKLLPAEGSTKPAGLWVYLPGQHILIAADTGKYFPDVAAITGPNPDVKDVIAGLNSILQLAPEKLVWSGQPLLEGAAVSEAVTAQRDALQYVYDQTWEKINAGYSVDEIAASVALTPELALSPYNQEFASTVPQVVRSIYHERMGWFGGETDELASTLTPDIKAQILADAYGGLENLVAAARQSELEARDLAGAEKALYLAHAAYKLAPEDPTVRQIYAQALRKNAFMQESGPVRNYYLTEASRLVSGPKSGLEDTPLAFGMEDFVWSYYNDPNTYYHHTILDRARILSLPPAETGVLALVGNPDPVTVGREISTAWMNALVFTPAADWNGETSFTWEGPSQGNSSPYGPYTITLTIRPVNDPPVLSGTPLADLNVNENTSPGTVDLSAAFTDVDIATNGDVLGYTSTSSNPDLVSTAVSGASLTLTYASNKDGSASITVTATDQSGASVSDDFTVTVNPVNNPPTARDASITLIAGQSQTITLDYSDLETSQANLQVTFGNLNGTLDSSALPGLTYTAPNTAGDDSFTYTVTDRGDPDGCTAAPCAAALSATATVHVTVLPASFGSISGLIYNDANGNGTNDGEAGLVGVTVELRDASDAVLATTTSAGDGSFTFGSLPAGTYRVRQVLSAGYLQTTPDPADATVDSGQAVTGVDFGSVFSADLKVAMTSAYNAKTKVITYTIVVTNDGPADAAASAVIDNLSGTVSFLSVTTSQGTCTGGKKVTCSLGTLTNGSSASVVLKVNRLNTKATITNTATVSSSIFDIDMADNTVTVTVP